MSQAQEHKARSPLLHHQHNGRSVCLIFAGKWRLARKRRGRLCGCWVYFLSSNFTEALSPFDAVFGLSRFVTLFYSTNQAKSGRCGRAAKA